jgi:cell filamentation protein
VTFDPLRHAVAQTIAAERLEGWAPTDEQVAALMRLAHDEVSFGDYLAGYRSRYPPSAPQREPVRILRRNRPYLIPGTVLLRNNFGAHTHAMLTDLEYVATAGRLVQWHRMLRDGRGGLAARSMHQHVFGDVYAWAGAYRVTELRRGDVAFAWQSSIVRRMGAIDQRTKSLAAVGANLDDAALGYELSRLYADFNQVHPFREGNGRTGTLLLHTVAARCARALDLSQISREEWYAASRDSMPFRRDGRANHRPFVPLLLRALTKPGDAC